MAITIPATNVYRAKVAAAAAAGSALPAATEIAFGTGTSGSDPEDTGLEAEVFRKGLDSVSAADQILTCTGELSGSESGQQITEVGIFDADGDLMGRRSFLPKQLEAESSLEFTLNFQF
jgi:phage-related tail fiber protein